MISEGRYVDDMDHPDTPRESGVVPNAEKFDGGFFGIHLQQIQTMDPSMRMILEKAVECVFDAGVHPDELRNGRTGVFAGVSKLETKSAIWKDYFENKRHILMGVSEFTIAHRIAYSLRLTGPAVALDTLCSSGLYALEHAFKAIQLGMCERAIVVGTNLILHSSGFLQFMRLGVVSSSGRCRPFDKNGDGYVKADAICAIFLQKRKDAQWIYAEIIHIRTANDGYKEQGVAHASRCSQERMLREFYNECSVNPSDVSYVEAHGTGTVVGDTEECSALDKVFGRGRQAPMLIGSVKSNVGHAEAPSGLVSVIKCIIAMESGEIPPNLHFKEPRESILGIKEGRLQVVVEKTKFQDDKGFIAVNSFGLGGANGHVLLKWHSKEKVDGGSRQDNLPRLICVSGRTNEAVVELLDDVTKRQLDYEYIGLLHRLFSKSIANHLHRGYVITSKIGEVIRSSTSIKPNRPPLYIVFGTLKNWRTIVNNFLEVPIFNQTIKRIQDILSSKGNNIFAILDTSDSSQILGNVIVSICIIDIIKALNILPCATVGCSFGELAAQYYEGLINLKDVISYAYALDNNISTEKHINIFTRTRWTNNYSKEICIENELEKIYHTNKFCSSKRFNPPQNYVIWKVGIDQQNGLVSKQHYNILSFGTSPNDVHFETLLQILGRLYEVGYEIEVEQLYPKVDFPVSKSTPMISPLIRWNHSKDWPIVKFKTEIKQEQLKFGIRLDSKEWSFISGHTVDGKNLFPAAGYLYLVWEALANLNSSNKEGINVIFEECRFLRAAVVPYDGQLDLEVTVFTQSGYFEVNEGGILLVNGKVFLAENIEEEFVEPNKFITITKEETMLAEDVYKEYRLRGYNYSGIFRGIKEYNLNTLTGAIKWDDNWIAFIDNLFQTKILQIDSRQLHVPTCINRMSISARIHNALIKRESNDANKPSDLPFHYCPNADIIRSGGIEVRGLQSRAINTKKYFKKPVLEAYKFIPNNAHLSLDQSIRVNLQIILENLLVCNLNVTEVIESSQPEHPLLSQIIKTALDDVVLVTTNITVLSKEELILSFPDEKRSLEEAGYTLLIISNLCNRPQMLNQVFQSIKKDGYVLARECEHFDTSSTNNTNIVIKTIHRAPGETLILITRPLEAMNFTTIKLSGSNEFTWIPEVQKAIKNGEEILLLAQNDCFPGLMGFSNCLRREPGGHNVRCLYLMDQDHTKQYSDQFYRNQLNKNMAMNIYKYGKWGTYRHLLLEETEVEMETDHAYADLLVKGDLSSLKWLQGPLRYEDNYAEEHPEKQLVKVHYASLNLRDIMIAEGGVDVEVLSSSRLNQHSSFGIEFSGITESGIRVMGMTPIGALSTMVLADKHFLLEIPDEWTMEDGATVMVAYVTVICALLIQGQLKHGQSIFIHSVSEGVDEAAIRTALHYDCNVFIAAGTPGMKEHLRETYPQLSGSNIGDLLDAPFEQVIMKQTRGKGVDIVLNSSSTGNPLASIKCLACGGRYLELGTCDISSNNVLNLLLLEKNCSIHSISLDRLLYSDPKEKRIIMSILKDNLGKGIVTPLTRRSFKHYDIENAFRFMTSSKRTTKVLVELNENEEESISPPPGKIKAIPRYCCSSAKSYIIIGGLGGFGLELTDWLILRGARQIILASRNGIKTGYQQWRIRKWKSYGVMVNISKADVTTEEGCLQLIHEATALGPLEGIFNLALVLSDGIFENQTAEKFHETLTPKAIATHYLDRVTRRLCPNLR